MEELDQAVVIYLRSPARDGASESGTANAIQGWIARRKPLHQATRLPPVTRFFQRTFAGSSLCNGQGFCFASRDANAFL